MDRRKQKTVNAIYDALEILLINKKYSEIGVQDIIEQADIARSTFYTFFTSKDEVLKTFIDNIFWHIESHDLQKELNHDFSNKDEFENRINHMLCHFEEDKTLLKAILTGESSHIFLARFKNHLEDLFRDNLKSTNIEPKVPQELAFLNLVSIFETLTVWRITENECEMTPKELTTAFFALTKDNYFF